MGEGTPTVEELQAKLAEMQRLLEEKDKSLSKTRHDLLSPLNAIIGFSGIMMEKLAGKIDDRQMGNLRRINDNGKQLLEQLRNLGKKGDPAAHAAEQKAAAEEEKSAPMRAPGAPRGSRVPIVSRGGKVLVVDDVESNRELLKQELTERGFEVKVAAGGAEALVLAREFQPSVIILDINMPEMDGMETCRRLKADVVTAHIPVLFLTGQRADEDSSVEALAAGGNDFLQKPYVPAVLLARVNSQVAIHDAQARLRQMVMTDELTGVFSRRFLFESMRQQIKRLTAPAGPPSIACLMCDVDHFKKINDRFGHLEGDRVLRTVASILRSTVRAGDFVARFGGEEFVVVCPNTSLEDSLVLGEKIRANVEAGSREVIPVTISIGVACYIPLPGDASADLEQKMDELFRLADEALYRAKDTGRNRVCQAA